MRHCGRSQGQCRGGAWWKRWGMVEEVGHRGERTTGLDFFMERRGDSSHYRPCEPGSHPPERVGLPGYSRPWNSRDTSFPTTCQGGGSDRRPKGTHTSWGECPPLAISPESPATPAVRLGWSQREKRWVDLRLGSQRRPFMACTYSWPSHAS